MDTKLYLADVRPLTDEVLFMRLLPCVSDARRAKVTAFRHEGARRLSLGAGLLLRFALRAEGLAAVEPCLTEYGKPFFSDVPDFHFNLSHSGDFVLCAVSPTPVGCDIEQPRQYDPALARRFFHPDERALLFSLPEEQQPEAFYRLWTCKESFMKAVGLGFNLPLSDFAVDLGEPPTLTQGVDGRPWRLRSFRLSEYFGALCGLAGVADAPILSVDLSEVKA